MTNNFSLELQTYFDIFLLRTFLSLRTKMNFPIKDKLIVAVEVQYFLRDLQKYYNGIMSSIISYGDRKGSLSLGLSYANLNLESQILDYKYVVDEYFFVIAGNYRIKEKIGLFFESRLFPTINSPSGEKFDNYYSFILNNDFLLFAGLNLYVRSSLLKFFIITNNNLQDVEVPFIPSFSISTNF